MRIVAIAALMFAAAFLGHVAESGEEPAQAITPANARAFAGDVVDGAAAESADALRRMVPFGHRARHGIKDRVGR